ncbi:hypothetical protein CT0861_11024 [Colletotrichum tofieldiae]|uniref:Uncharacterized protein n=1 Tax=Colletotrichum tofieldiae TaxID=708197 RepID=A0A161YMJ8_9PEZI|nr:hypothetical protein CT0861_11024 [Colletotrichum tofieldiae]
MNPRVFLTSRVLSIACFALPLTPLAAQEPSSPSSGPPVRCSNLPYCVLAKCRPVWLRIKLLILAADPAAYSQQAYVVRLLTLAWCELAALAGKQSWRRDKLCCMFPCEPPILEKTVQGMNEPEQASRISTKFVHRSCHVKDFQLRTLGKASESIIPLEIWRAMPRKPKALCGFPDSKFDCQLFLTRTRLGVRVCTPGSDSGGSGCRENHEKQLGLRPIDEWVGDDSKRLEDPPNWLRISPTSHRSVHADCSNSTWGLGEEGDGMKTGFRSPCCMLLGVITRVKEGLGRVPTFLRRIIRQERHWMEGWVWDGSRVSNPAPPPLDDTPKSPIRRFCAVAPQRVSKAEGMFGVWALIWQCLGPVLPLILGNVLRPSGFIPLYGRCVLCLENAY